jgi:hypothetical protein
MNKEPDYCPALFFGLLVANGGKKILILETQKTKST